MAKKNQLSKVNNKAQNLPAKSDIRKVINVPVQLYRITTDLLKYRNGVLAAENITSPQRYNLYQVYQQAMLDAHLSAAFQQLKNLILGRNFCVNNPDGKKNEDKTKLIKTKWFRDYLDLAMDSAAWGHSLIQFDSIIEVNGIEQFKDVYLVPRIFVKPEFHIVTHDYSATDGEDYLEKPYRNWCIGVGKSHDLGLLLKATPLVIWKKNALGAWAEFVEKFGTPIRVGKTADRDPATVKNMENMLMNMGTSAWGLFDLDDQIELIETKQQDAFNVFNEMINRCNSEISKLILGQTSTLDEKAFVGSAEVHERVLKGFAELYEQMINGVNNYQLIPMMNELGFGLEGMTIGIEAEDELTLDEKGKFDIELLKTGKYKFTPEYIKEKYGTDVIEVSEPVVSGIQKTLNELYK